MMQEDIEIVSQGRIYLTMIDEDGNESKVVIKNKVLLNGRHALASCLGNEFNGEFPFYITRVLFGNNGTIGGAPRLIDDSRDGLFGATTLAKPVIASIDMELPHRVTFTTTVTKTELAGEVINEMALEMATGDLFSMATFGDINKSSTTQMVWNWRISFC